MEISGFYPFKQATEKTVLEGKPENNETAYGKAKIIPKKQEAVQLKDKPRWTEEEDQLLLELYMAHGTKWNQISLYFINRPSSSIKNHFYRLRSMMTADQRTEIKETLRVNKAKSTIIMHNNITSLSPEDIIKNDLEVALAGSITINDVLIQNLGGSLNSQTETNEISEKRSKLKILHHWESILNNLVEIKKNELGINSTNYK